VDFACYTYNKEVNYLNIVIMRFDLYELR